MGGKRRHDAITASDNKSQNNGRALGLNQRALDICLMHVKHIYRGLP